MNDGKNVWRLCLLAGGVVIVVQVAMGLVENTEPCGPANGLPAILAFELVRSPDDVEALFGDQPCRGRLVAAMDQINQIDVYAFIPAFTAFLVLGSLAVRSQNAAVAWLAVLAAVVAGLSDQAEDQILFSISADLPGTQSQIDRLFWFVRLKFVLLGVVPILIGALLQKQAGWFRLLGWVMIGGGFVAVFGTLGPYQWMTPGIGAGWVALLIAAAMNSFRPQAGATLDPESN